MASTVRAYMPTLRTGSVESVRWRLYPTGMTEIVDGEYTMSLGGGACAETTQRVDAMQARIREFRVWVDSLQPQLLGLSVPHEVQKELGLLVAQLLATNAELVALLQERGKLGDARDAIAALARSCDLSHREARELLDTNSVLRSGSGVAHKKFLQGEIGIARAREVAKGVAVHPEFESQFCKLAATGTAQDVRRRRLALRHRSPAAEEQVSRRQAVLRSCRRWTDDEGMWNVHARLTPVEGAEVLRVFTPYRQRAFDARKAAGLPLEGPLIAADGFMGLVRKHRDHLEECDEAIETADTFSLTNGSDSAGSVVTLGSDTTRGTNRVSDENNPRDESGMRYTGEIRNLACLPNGGQDWEPAESNALKRQDLLDTRSDRRNRNSVGEVQLLVSVEALRRGYVDHGEFCEIPGVGSVSVTEAKKLLGDRTYRLLVHSGRDVRSITGVGRTIPQSLRRAVEFRDPKCVVAGCEAQEFLEFDHVVPFARGGPTTYGNLRRLCHHHHRLITEFGYTLEPELASHHSDVDTTETTSDRPLAGDDDSSLAHLRFESTIPAQWVLKPPGLPPE